MKRTLPNIGLLLLVYWVLLITGCATTQQTRSVEPSGFLGDYSQLKEGVKDRALLYYLDPDAKFSKYNQVMIDPVSMWVTEDSTLKDLPKDELLNLGHYFYMAVRRQLEPDYAIVENPGPNTMRIRLALTEAKGSKVVLDTVSTVIPTTRLISTGKKLATGTHSFVGQATAEVEILDSITNRRLAAAVDSRAGGRTLKGSTDTWDDVNEAADYWAKQLRTRLEELRSVPIKW
jgi:hypothetical protein